MASQPSELRASLCNHTLVPIIDAYGICGQQATVIPPIKMQPVTQRNDPDKLRNAATTEPPGNSWKHLQKQKQQKRRRRSPSSSEESEESGSSSESSSEESESEDERYGLELAISGGQFNAQLIDPWF